MNKERYNQIIDEVYDNYKTEWMKENPPFAGPYTDPCLTQDELIKKCKTDSEFSETWGLKIEERELSLEERSIIAKSNHYEVSQNIKMFVRVDEDHSLHKNLDDGNIPTKLITLTFNNETIESYE